MVILRRLPLIFLLSVPALPGLAAAPPARDWRHTALKGHTPTNEILRLDIDGDGKPDVLERWWNGKRVRWLDENHDMAAGDMRGDQVSDVLQIDMDGDGLYDGPGDQNIKWADNDGDGRPDVQVFAINQGGGGPNNHGPHWMLFIDPETDKDGVLGWENWQTFDFDCWGYTGHGNWLPDYHGNAVFLKMHADPSLLEDPSLNWENPFSFYDTDGDGVSEMAMRWLDPQTRTPTVAKVTGSVNEAFLAYDLDNDSGKGNETDFDLTLRAFGGDGIPYRDDRHPMPGLKGDPRFDRCFASNNWRRIDSVSYISDDKGWEAFFGTTWKSRWLVFDEDDDDHRWERVEMYYPTHGPSDPEGTIDPYSTKRWSKNTNSRVWNAEGAEKPGLGGHPQADSLGDRGEYDRDDSGRGKLYVGVFDGKLHLAGAESGAWTVDIDGRYHGGTRLPPPNENAAKVEELVTYRDTDGNGFFDTIEFDYDGDRTVDLKVSLLDYRTAALPHPDEVPLLDTKALRWAGLHEAFTKMANESWRQALGVYRAAWRRGLTDPELDRLANAASVAQRYDSAYWIKEKVFRVMRARLGETAKSDPRQAKRWTTLGEDLKRLYYLGQYDEYVKRIAEVPGR
jgi:hypothetical protein